MTCRTLTSAVPVVVFNIEVLAVRACCRSAEPDVRWTILCRVRVYHAFRICSAPTDPDELDPDLAVWLFRTLSGTCYLCSAICPCHIPVNCSSVNDTVAPFTSISCYIVVYLNRLLKIRSVIPAGVRYLITPPTTQQPPYHHTIPLHHLTATPPITIRSHHPSPLHPTPMTRHHTNPPLHTNPPPIPPPPPYGHTTSRPPLTFPLSTRGCRQLGDSCAGEISVTHGSFSTRSTAGRRPPGAGRRTAGG